MRTPPLVLRLVLTGAVALGTALGAAACGSNDPDVVLNEAPAEESEEQGAGGGEEGGGEGGH